MSARCCGAGPGREAADPRGHFARMIGNCLEYAKAEKAMGRPIVGILCEYTPREIIMAAGAVPVCLCGGSAETAAAAEAELPANLCPLIKSTYGYHLTRSNPFLEMADLVVAETTCDGKKKMYELMGRNRPVYILELPQKPDDPDAFEHWVRELRKLRAELERRFGARIGREELEAAIRMLNEERALRRNLAALMQAEAPPLTGRELLAFKSSIACIPADLAMYAKALEELAGRGGAPSAARRTRILMTGVPMAHGAERVLEILEERGGLVVALESCVGLKPIVEDVEERTADPMVALARKYMHLPCSVMTPNDRRLDLLRRLAADYRAQCVVELVWQACLTYDLEAARVKRFVEQELGLPYLRIETDYSPSDSARIAVRVEALLETVAARAGG